MTIREMFNMFFSSAVKKTEDTISVADDIGEVLTHRRGWDPKDVLDDRNDCNKVRTQLFRSLSFEDDDVINKCFNKRNVI